MAHCRPVEAKPEAISKLLVEVFPFTSVETSSLKALVAFEDRNYCFQGLLQKDLVDSYCATSSNRYILKLSHSSFSQRLVEGLNAVMRFLRAKGFMCSYPIPTRTGKEMAVLSSDQLLCKEAGPQENGEQLHCTRVLSYISGEKMASVPHLNARVLYDVGNMVGRMDAALQEFSHSELDSRKIESRICINMKYFMSIKEILQSIQNPEKQKIILDNMRDFEDHVVPKLPQMRCGIIHGDATTSNIILDTEVGSQGQSPYSVPGVIDFSSCHRTCIVFELAITLAHTIKLAHKNHAELTPVEYVCPLISGYLEAFPLTDIELGCLYYAASARLCAVSAVCESLYLTHPQCYPHLKGACESYWRALAELRDLGEEEVGRIWSDMRKKRREDY